MRFVLLVAALVSFPAAKLFAQSETAPAARDAQPEKLPVGALSPQQALDAFALGPGLRVELVAAEPLVDSPVAMAFDEQGYLYVAENRGYPTGPAEGEPPLGRIARLSDTDGDGRYDQRTEFAPGPDLSQWRHAVARWTDRHLRAGHFVSQRY